MRWVSMTTVQIAPGHSLSKAGADSYFRMQVMGMPSGGINDSYRSHATQRALFLARYTPRPQSQGNGPYNDVRWYEGVRYVRTSALGSVAVPGSSKSRHETGLALDISTSSAAYEWIKRYGRDHGWVSDVPGEPWHFEYRSHLDKKPKPKKPISKDKDMPARRYGQRSKSQKLVKDKWTTIQVTDNNGVSTAFGAKLFETQLVLGLKAPTNTQVRVRAYKMNYATGKRGYTYDKETKVDSPKTTGNTLHFDVTAVGELKPDERLRFEVYTWNDNVEITGAAYRTSEWN